MPKQVTTTSYSLSQKAAIVVLKSYRLLLSPFMGNQCRFYPSCSQYTESAIKHYGILKGIFYGLWRILRCNPFHSGGYDPVPRQPSTREKSIL